MKGKAAMIDNRIITLEEHFATAQYAHGEGGAFDPTFGEFVQRRITDIESVRLPEMDECGIDIQVLALTSPGIQGETDLATAKDGARSSNNAMAAVVAEHPTRFSAFAALPTQSGRAAAEELRRCVEELGFVGALVNGHTNDRYLDDAEYEPLWETLEELNVPLYIHPIFPVISPSVLEGYPEITAAAWGWGFETGSHALRVILSGVFDRHPSANIILGHMGEGLPLTLTRLDDRYSVLKHSRDIELRPSEYIRRNVYITSSGVESAEPLRATIDALGVDRVMYSIDYPYQDMYSATRFLKGMDLSPLERIAFSGGNAARILKL